MNPAEQRQQTAAPKAADTATMALSRLRSLGKLINRKLNAEWADEPRGIKIDPVPNPKRWLVLSNGILSISVDCGEPGAGVKP